MTIERGKLGTRRRQYKTKILSVDVKKSWTLTQLMGIGPKLLSPKILLRCKHSHVHHVGDVIRLAKLSLLQNSQRFPFLACCHYFYRGAPISTGLTWFLIIGFEIHTVLPILAILDWICLISIVPIFDHYEGWFHVLSLKYTTTQLGFNRIPMTQCSQYFWRNCQNWKKLHQRKFFVEIDICFDSGTIYELLSFAQWLLISEI